MDFRCYWNSTHSRYIFVAIDWGTRTAGKEGRASLRLVNDWLEMIA